MSYRTHWCASVARVEADSRVRVAGWVHRRRDHGGLVFIDLRDRTGLVQLVFDPEHHEEAHRKAHDLRGELSLIHISEPTRRTPISYAVFCLIKKKFTI